MTGPSPFGPQGQNPPGPPPGVRGDYRLGEIDAGERKNFGRQEVYIFRAPWLLLISGAIMFVSCVFLVFKLAEQWIADSSARDFNMELGLTVLAVGFGLALMILTLRTHRIGRIGLTGWAVLALITLLGELWPVGVGALIILVLIWLPPSSRWIF